MRRTKPEKRIIEPDVRFNNLNIQVLIHHVLRRARKALPPGSFMMRWILLKTN